MIRMRLFTGCAILLGGLGLTGCGQTKGDFGAERQDNHQATPLPREEKPAVASVPEAQPTEVAMRTPAESGNSKAAEVVDISASPAKANDAQPSKPVGAPAADDPKPEPTPAPAPAPTVTPAPAPAPGGESAEDKAKRILDEAVKIGGVERQAQDATAQSEFDTALKLFNNLEYEEALKHFERAVQLDPTNRVAQEKLRTCRSLLGVRMDRIAEKVRALEHEERVKIQEALVALANALEEGRVYENKGSSVPLELEDAAKEKVLAEQLENLRQAQDRYRRVKEIMNYMPPQIDLPNERKAVEESLVRVRQKLLDKDDEISFLRRLQAQKVAEETRVRETELFHQRVKKLNEQVADLYHKGLYKDAERLSLRVLQMDPFNSEAEGWKRKARSAYRSSESADIKHDFSEGVKDTWEEVDASHIPYGNLLTYPTNWDVIARRPQRNSIGKSKVEDQWKQDIKKRLQRKVTFEFVDTPLDEAISFLRSLTNVTMIVDPKVTQAGAPPISLRVTDMSLDLALEWLLKLADLDYALKDNAIFISKRQSLVEDVELKIYDVSDLTQAVPDFPGPDFQLTTPGDDGGAGGGGAAGAANPFVAAPAPTVTVQSIADMIRNRVKPDSWDPNQGTSIEERAGKLVVMQRPEVHGLIDQLLSNFRATQKILVNIEGRFLTIREAYLEDLGVEFQGLDPNVLHGDFGDIRNIGGVTGQLVQPRNNQPLDAPFPGVVDGPNPFLGGMLSTVGSIVNNVVNFFPVTLDNSLDTISANDPNNTLRQGGLSAQVTLLGKAQMQAFIKALGIRENTSTLFAPRLTCFNTQRAHMFVARQRTYIADYDISGDAYDPVIRQFLTGAVLDVRPTVSSDRRYVTMELRPTVTEGTLQPSFIQSFTVLTGAQVTIVIPLTFPIDFPNLTIRRVRTTATVPDGGILLIGGLQRNVKFQMENGVPFLSDLPVLGRLFRWNTQDNSKSNLAIMVSPRIILFNEEEAKL
ncbi:MAG: hypothetical protein HY291_04490 [Planctomycetes bacterium]|nr:hypothetical protein [Planctomycetota bacterium]